MCKDRIFSPKVPKVQGIGKKKPPEIKNDTNSRIFLRASSDACAMPDVKRFTVPGLLVLQSVFSVIRYRYLTVQIRVELLLYSYLHVSKFRFTLKTKIMSKTIKLQNAGGRALHKMSEIEIRQLVEKQTQRILESIPKEIRVADVNSVQLESSLKEAADVGVWAQWTRACCDKRAFIDDFTDPAIAELAISSAGIERAVHQNHFDSNFSIKQVTEEASLQKIKAGGK